jgi:UDP-3-O-[3-hydroxymyristoyl] glucosamine N-acyltransferase
MSDVRSTHQQCCAITEARATDKLLSAHNCTYAGDNHHVEIGHNTNLQDGVSVGSLNPSSSSTKVGSGVSVGHGAVLQGCTVEDNVLIGMKAVLQDGVKVSSRAATCSPSWGAVWELCIHCWQAPAELHATAAATAQVTAQQACCRKHSGAEN